MLSHDAVPITTSGLHVSTRLQSSIAPIALLQTFPRLTRSTTSDLPSVLYADATSLVVKWSESLTTNHEVPGTFLEGEDSRGDHGLVSLVEFRFKGPPGTTSPYITTHIIGTA